MILIPIRLKFDTRKLQNYAKCREIDLHAGVKIKFHAILSEIWDLDGPYLTNLEYKLVKIVWKII